jgi:phytoene synthase
MTQSPTEAKTIFKSGSTTYYYSSIFFPKHIKEDVFTLYAYVRTADNYVDEIPQDKKGFEHFVADTQKALQGKEISNAIISDFITLVKRKKIDPSWIDAFLNAMQSDLFNHTYKRFSDLEKYMFGSAEVIGLMMSAILELPQEAYEAARFQGKAMQLINFIRDVQEDLDLGRTYIPEEDLKKFNIKTLQLKEVQSHPKDFENLVHYEIDRYNAIQKAAEAGYHYIPRRYRIPIKTAAYMYNWTAKQIAKNPFIVFEKKVKPSKTLIFAEIIKNMIFI